ncbi:MAG: D-alanyl-D-alanine carboxypeptidase family protein [Candidatus Pacebacteria bacterium]|nr:D-alanyl-D-alanine carboxypeptidase family protein [Candidatus Paceibacterota bacterium]
MNNVFKRIIFLFIFLVVGFSYLPSSADAACSISSVTFSEVTGIVGNFEENFTNLKITTDDCSDGIRVQLMSMNEAGQPTQNRIDGLPGIFFPDPTTQEVHMKLKTDEDTCFGNNNENDAGPNWGHECVVFTEISNVNNQPIYDGNSPALVPSEVEAVDTDAERATYRNRGVLLGNCSGFCGAGLLNEDDVDNWDFIQIYQNGGSTPDSANCQLSNQSSNPDVYFDVVPGQSITDRQVKLNIKTEGKCESIPLKIQLWEQDSVGDNTIDIENSVNGDYLEIVPPTDEDLHIVYDANEDDCDGDDDPGGWDCELYVEIFKDGSRIFSSEEFLNNTGTQSFLDNINFKKGVIVSECEDNGDCRNSGNDWRLLDSNGFFENGNDPANVSTVTPTFDTTSPCYQQNANNSGQPGYNRDCYELLAPIPGLQSTNNDGVSNIIVQEDGSIAIARLSEFKLGDYINSLFQIALAILAVLSVVMIVVGGVQYMTTEAIFQKEAAKGYISKAVLGLILALGIFVILNTINPRLLNINFGEGVETVEIDTGDGGVEPTGGAEFGIVSNNNCSEFVTINQPDAITITRFDVCKPIEQDIIDLLAAAKADGIILTAYGARSSTRQIELRQQNCGTSQYDVYQKPPSQCSPPTAIPGTSWHESGFALDFQCVLNGQEGAVNVHAGNTNGTKKLWTQPCWNWLLENARDYNLQNIRSENWHWNSSRR